MIVKTVIIGFGNVGRALLKELVKIKEFNIVGLASSRGAVIVQDNKDLKETLLIAKKKQKLDKHSKFIEGLKSIELAKETNAKLAFIAIPPSYETGEPNRRIYYGLTDLGVSIVTADKTVLAREYIELKNKVHEKGLFIGYRATVAAGTPILDVARGLRGRGVERIRAVLNATTNYILSLMEEGLSYREAVEKAIEEELAEPNPQVDTHGWDPAAKLAITVSELGTPITIMDVIREPLETIPEEEVRRAIGEGYRIKYIAEAILGEEKYIVHPAKIKREDRLANVSGNINVVEFTLENEKVVIEGPAGPAWRTAKVMVTDAIEYLETRKQLKAS